MTRLPQQIAPTYRIAPETEQATKVARPARRAPMVISAVLSLGIGFGLFFMGAFEYPGRASFQIDGRSRTQFDANPVSAQRNAVQKELAAFMAEIRADAKPSNGLLRWQIDAEEADAVVLRAAFSSHSNATTGLRQLAESFLARLKEVGRLRRTMPSQAEQILADYVNQLETRADSAVKIAGETAAAFAAADPKVDRQTLLEKWRSLRGDVQSRREELRNTSDELEHLRGETIPETGIVTSSKRKSAIESDSALCEDLSELTVRLTEVKRVVQKVDEDCREPLEASLHAAEEFGSTLSKADRSHLEQTTVELLDKLQQNTTGFLTSIANFADSWRSAFRGVDQTTIDSQSAALLDQQLRLETMLSSMLFDAGKRLTAIRTQIGALEQSPKDDARHHVLISDITRGFQAMQTSFHRFEFTAGAIDGRNNFRLDAALRSARGLHRRTREAISQIDKTLAKQAGDLAKKEHELVTARAEERLAQLRAASDQSVDQLLTAQDGINLADDSNESLARVALRAELAAANARSAQEDLDRARNQLQTLTSQRMNSDISEGVTLATCSVDSRPSNLLDRTWTSALAAMCVFITLLVVQLWNSRG